MPTPSDILTEVNHLEALANRSPAKPAEANRAKKKEKNKDAVPWAYKTYKQIEAEGLMPALIDHIQNKLTPKQADEYVKYLVHWCEFPKAFQNDFRNNTKKV
jgi:hypothetical protein